MSSRRSALAACFLLLVPALSFATESSAPATAAAGNPLLAKWTGPYGGVPPFDKVKVADFKPALEAAMAENLAEIDAIANNPATPNFENTIAALERAGKPFERVSTIYGIFRSTMSSDDFQTVERRWRRSSRPSTTRSSRTRSSSRASARSTTPANRAGSRPSRSGSSGSTTRSFVRAGAKLERRGEEARGGDQPAPRDALHEVQPERARRRERLRRSSSTGRPTSPACPSPSRAGAAAAAETRGHKGKWAILNTRSSMEPFLTYSDRRDLREKVWRTFYNRGDNGDAHDNNTIITEILKLRAERAKLLGYATHAHWRLENSMAKTPERAMELMEAVWKPAVARVHEEVADMQAIADAAARRRREDHDRALGLPLLRREGPQGEVRPRPERGQAVPAAREAARGDVLGRGRALRASQFTPVDRRAGRTTRTCASGR